LINFVDRSQHANHCSLQSDSSKTTSHVPVYSTAFAGTYVPTLQGWPRLKNTWVVIPYQDGTSVTQNPLTSLIPANNWTWCHITSQLWWLRPTCYHCAKLPLDQQVT